VAYLEVIFHKPNKGLFFLISF